jgi:hypothetical protein
MTVLPGKTHRRRIRAGHTDDVPDSVVGVLVALIAVAPGFIATSVWSRVRSWRGADGDVRVILQSLVFTAIIHTVLAPLTLTVIYPVRETLLDHPVRLSVWVFLLVLVVPSLIGQLTARAANSVLPPDRALDPESRARGWRGTVQGLVGGWDQPSIWDAVVLARRLDGCFVVVEFNDGRRVAGAFGVGSAAMNHPGRPGLFLTPEWALDEDGELLAEIPDSRGVMLPTLDDVRWIRIQASPADEGS